MGDAQDSTPEPNPQWYEESWAVYAAGAGALAVIIVLVFAVVQTSRGSMDPGHPPAPATEDAPTTSRTTTTTTTRTRSTQPSTSDINPSDTSPGPTTTTDDWVPDFPELTGTTTTTWTDPYATSTSAPRAGAI
ncbi:MAG: hypothetical protein HYZ39_12905 [Mycolicibacterium cosmeticum]|nr:hypothetical protein [Mycolicibacterium cosmeticum]